MADNETIVDIIAEMRHRKEMLEDAAFNAPLCYSIETMRAQSEILDEFVERFEAAHGRELSKTRPKKGDDFGQFDADALRDALKDVEATVTAALAHQPEDEAKCGQFLYDALVKCFNIADLACHAARTEKGAAVSREAATTENSSAVGNAAKLREAVVRVRDFADRIVEDRGLALAIINTCDAALAAPARNCDKYPTFNDAIRALADKRGWHDAKWDSERYCILASWLFAPSTEKEGGNDADK